MIKKTYDRWCIFNAQNQPTSCVLGLPGRGMTGFNIAYDYYNTYLDKTLIVGITPHDFEWYPMPNGANDQEKAIKGIPAAVEAIEKVISRIQNLFGFPDDKIAIVGFSAGAVMTLQTIAHLGRKFAGAIGHGGAILDTDGLPEAKTDTPVFIQHNMNDSAFSWEERYLPMQYALKNRKYNVKFIERLDGGHGVSRDDMIISNLMLSDLLGYEKGNAKKTFGADLFKAYKKSENSVSVEEYFSEVNRKDDAGELTVGFAPFNYLRLEDGEQKGRIVIKTNAKIDDQSVLFFADTLTWTYAEKYKNSKCKIVVPNFGG